MNIRLLLGQRLKFALLIMVERFPLRRIQDEREEENRLKELNLNQKDALSELIRAEFKLHIDR